MLFIFEACEFHPATRRLLINGVEQVLGGRAFDLLQALIENHQRVVSKDELYERVWPGLAVEPGNLQVQVWALRKVLGRHVIATVARRGYRFMPTVRRVPLGLTAPNAADKARTAPSPAPAARLDTLVGVLADHRLVTLVDPDTGPGDHLAQAAAQWMAPRLAGRVWQIEAAVLTGQPPDPSDATTPVEGALFTVPPTSTRLQALLSRIARRPALLVVLNGHRAVGLAEAVTHLLAGSPGLRLLVRNPQPLALPGEKLLTLSGDRPELEGFHEPPPDRRATGLRWHSR